MKEIVAEKLKNCLSPGNVDLQELTQQFLHLPQDHLEITAS